MKIRAIAALAALACLSGCMTPIKPVEPAWLPPATLTAGMRTVAEREVADQLKDPYSAQFQNMRAFQKEGGTFAVCGLVNGKNSYGGYVGFVPFIAYVATGTGAKAGQYFPIGANVSSVDQDEIFYQIVPLCRA